MAANLSTTFNDSLEFTPATRQYVYTRSFWDDEWELQEQLWCNGCTWTLAPGLGSAELTWNYGHNLPFDETTFRVVLPDDGSRRYVKVVYENLYNLINDELVSASWHGVVLGAAEQVGGVRVLDDTAYGSGQQTIQCVSLEKILDERPILTSAWSDDGEERWIDRGLTFNAPKADGSLGGNMATAGNWLLGIPAFSNRVLYDDAFWTTRHALKYLVKFHAPRDLVDVRMPLAIDPASLALLLISNDRPQITTHGRTLRELLNQLLPPPRFMTWTLDVDEAFNAMFIRIVSLSGSIVPLPSADFLDANPRRWAINLDSARGRLLLTLSHAEGVDRCRVQGARATSTFTISYADGTLEAGYTAAQKAAYDAGATTTAAYAAAAGKKDRKRKLHAEVRTHETLRMVYSRFQIPDDWDGLVQNGEGAGDLNHFCPIVTETALFDYNPRELMLEAYLPLRDGYSYSTLGGDGEPIAPALQDVLGPHNNLAPLVLMKIPATGIDASTLAATPRWIYVDHIGLGKEIVSVPSDSDRGWSAHADVPREDRAIVVRVSGAPQWIIAGADYTQIRPDERIKYVWDWKTIVATVTAKWDAHCEGFWPPFEDLPLTDYIRERVFDAGPDYRLDWLVPQTVIGIDAEGALQRSAEGGWIQDDREILKDRARLAFEWYSLERRSVVFVTAKINGTLRLGDFIVTIGDQITHTINTVISSIRVDSPASGIDSEPPLPTQQFTTDWIPDLDLYLSHNLRKIVRSASDPRLPPAP